MPTAEEALRRYKTPFQRHLAFFDRNDDGFIHYGESLRGNLSIGLDFPVAAVMAMGYHLMYGNIGSALYGPFRGIEIARVQTRRNMLERVQVKNISAQGLDRKTLVAAALPEGFVDRMHVNGLWAFAASREGYLRSLDVKLYQQGTMLFELEKRRKDNRDFVLPLLRGGPISVAGHSWFVDKLFGVKVYQLDDDTKKR